MGENTFFGRSFDYWIELQNTMQSGFADGEKIIAENARLRAKVNFYEQQAKEAAQFLAVTNELR